MISCDAYRNGRCLGTKEVDPCDCDGDKIKCSFYEYVRKQGRELEKTYESNRIKNAIASYYLDHMNDDERCPWCTNVNGKTDLDFGIFCPFYGRRLQEKSYKDTVPVVRCKNCVHYGMGVCLKIYDDGAASSYAWQERKPDDFCSYGKRRKDLQNERSEKENSD